MGKEQVFISDRSQDPDMSLVPELQAALQAAGHEALTQKANRRNLCSLAAMVAAISVA